MIYTKGKTKIVFLRYLLLTLLLFIYLFSKSQSVTGTEDCWQFRTGRFAYKEKPTEQDVQDIGKILDKQKK